MASLACTILLLVATSGARADESAVAPTEAVAAGMLDGQGAVAFADSLLGGGDPFNALTFYRLGLHLLGEGERAPSIRFRIAYCYELGDRWDAAEAAYLDLAGRYPTWSVEATFRAAMAVREAGDLGLARVHLGDVLLEAPGSARAEEAAYLDALLSVEGGALPVASARLGAFQQQWPASSLAPRAAQVRSVLDQPVRRRSPAVAGVMSAILPGSGQVYAGHVGDGVMALLSSGGTAAWSISLIGYGLEDDRSWAIATGSVFAAIGAFLWASNVVGAVRGAHRANHLRVHQRADEALELALDPDLERLAEDVDLERLDWAASPP